MQQINGKENETGSISELYRLRTDSGELRCLRINVPEGRAGELLLRIPSEGPLSIEEVFVERKYRRNGLGSRLVSFAEDTADSLKLQAVELRPFSVDPIISDMELRDWYAKKGYLFEGGKMLKKICPRTKEVTA